MRRLSFFIILTADGLYADPDGGLDHYEPTEDEHQFANDLVRSGGDLIYGRVMYDVMHEYWDAVDLADPDLNAVEREFTEVWRATPKHVVSRGKPALGTNATLVEGDVVEAVRRMKAQPGGDLMLGCGAALLATLAGAGLIDEYRLLLTPTALGHGKAIFGALDAPLHLRLTGTRTFPTGSVLLEYEPASTGSAVAS